MGKSQTPEERIPESRTPEERIPESRTPEGQIPESQIPESQTPESPVKKPTPGIFGKMKRQGKSPPGQGPAHRNHLKKADPDGEIRYR